MTDKPTNDPETHEGRMLVAMLPHDADYWRNRVVAIEDEMNLRWEERVEGLDGERLYRMYWRTQWDNPGLVGYKPSRQWEQLLPEEQSVWHQIAARLSRPSDERDPESEEPR